MLSNSDVNNNKNSDRIKTRQQEPESEYQVSPQDDCVEMKAEDRELNYMLENTENAPEWKMRRKNRKRAINTWGYVALATVGLPLITVGAVSFVILTAAGTLSPPVLLGMKMYKKYTSNPWWTYSRNQIRYAVVRGTVAGTMFLPFLAPWGVYKLFRAIVTKVGKARFWKRPVEYEESFFQIIGEDIRVEMPRNLKEKRIENQGNSKETGSEIVTLNRTISLENKENALENNACQVQTSETSLPMFLSAAAYSEILKQFSNLNNSIELEGFHTIFNPSCNANREEESSEFKIPCDSGNFFYPLMRQPEDGREAVSDEENEYGRRDIQQSWIRRAMSEGSFKGKVSDETFRSFLNWREVKRDRLTRVFRRSDPRMYHQLSNCHEDNACTGQGNAKGKRDIGRACKQIQVGMEPETCKGMCSLSRECSIQSGKSHGVARSQSGLGDMQTNKPEKSKAMTVKRVLKQRFGLPVQEQENGMIRSQEESRLSPAAQKQMTRTIREMKTLPQPRQELEESLPSTLTLISDRKNRGPSYGMLKHEPVKHWSVTNKTNEGGSDLVCSYLQGRARATNIRGQKEKQLSSEGRDPALVKSLTKQDRDGQNITLLRANLNDSEVDMSEHSASDIIARFDQID